MPARTISVGATAFLVGATFALLARDAFFGHGPVSISLQVLGFALVGWARITFGIRSFRFTANPTQGALVTTGPYRYIRNPIYAAAWLIIWTGGCGALVTGECDAGGRCGRDVDSKDCV